MKRQYNLQDLALRAAILVSGAVEAALFVMQGDGHALPALAVGSMLGACLVGVGESGSAQD